MAAGVKAVVPSFAYLFERFPAFTQTFVVREALEMVRQGMSPLFVSLREPEPELTGQFPAEAREQTVYLPPPDELVAEIKRRRADGELPRPINQRLQAWGAEPDKMRLYEAIYTGALLRKKRITHIHAHFAGVAARTAFLIEELYGISFSWTGHAQDIFCETGFQITLGDLVRKGNLIVTETDFSARFLRKKFPFAAGKIHRVYNGIDLPAAKPTRRITNPPQILSVGRYIEKKGFDVLIAACDLLKKTGIAFCCSIVGEGPLQEALQDQIDRLNLQQEICLTGPRPQAEIASLLTEATVFCLASRTLADGDSDNFPTVITEAMTFGLPVISTPVGGISEQIEDGTNGLLVPENDAAQLAVALEKMISNPALANTMGEAGYQRARDRFGRETTVRELRSLLAGFGGVRIPWRLRLNDRWAGK